MSWTENVEVILHIRSLKDVGHSWELIHSYLVGHFPDYDFPTSYDSIRKRYNEHKHKISKKDNIDIAFYTYEEAYKGLCKYIGKKKEIKQPKKKNKLDKKILVLSDLHIPFHNEESLKKAVETHSDADILVLGGDFLDCYSISRFAKYKNIPLKEEIVQATAMLDFLASRFPDIIILSGNHEDRVKKYFASKVSADVLFLVQFDLMGLIAKPYDNVKIVKDQYVFERGNGEAEISHFTKIGKDFLIGHFERSSSIPLRAANLAYNWVDAWSKWFDIGDISLYLQGHTHKLSKYPLDKVVIGETGCLCQIQDYAIEPKARYSAHLNGYWVVYQKDGITDIDASNFYIL